MLWVIVWIEFISLQSWLLLWNKWISSLDRWCALSSWGPWEISYRDYRRDKTASESPPSAEEMVGGNWPGLKQPCRHSSLSVVRDRVRHASGKAVGLCPAGVRGQITSGDRRRDGVLCFLSVPLRRGRFWLRERQGGAQTRRGWKISSASSLSFSVGGVGLLLPGSSRKQPKGSQSRSEFGVSVEPYAVVQWGTVLCTFCFTVPKPSMMSCSFPLSFCRAVRDQGKVWVGPAKRLWSSLPEVRVGDAVMGLRVSDLQESWAAALGSAAKKGQGDLYPQETVSSMFSKYLWVSLQGLRSKILLVRSGSFIMKVFNRNVMI